MNQQKILRALMRLGTVSRAQLAKATGISQPTVGRIVDDLLGAQIVTEALQDNCGGQGNGKRERSCQLGRPSTRLELDRNRHRFMAIHLGIRRTRMAPVPIAGSVVDRWPADLPTPSSPDEWFDAVAAAWSELADRTIEAVVVSLPGVVDERQNRVLFSPNLRWCESPRLARMVGRLAPRARIVFVQEVRALALGQLAADPGLEDFLLVDFGTGVGAAAMIAGKIYHGPLPLSGELGHTPVIGNSRRCGCGSTGCVETLMSREGLVATARRHGGPGTWDELVSLLDAGDLPDWLLPGLDAAATAVVGAMNVMGLGRAVLTGTVERFPALGHRIGKRIQESSMWSRFGAVRYSIAPRRRMAGIVSAAIDHVYLADGSEVAATGPEFDLTREFSGAGASRTV